MRTRLSAIREGRPDGGVHISICDENCCSLNFASTWANREFDVARAHRASRIARRGARDITVNLLAPVPDADRRFEDRSAAPPTSIRTAIRRESAAPPHPRYRWDS